MRIESLVPARFRNLEPGAFSLRSLAAELLLHLSEQKGIGGHALAYANARAGTSQSRPQRLTHAPPACYTCAVENLLELLTWPWPWYLAGPAIGLLVPLLSLSSGRRFGVSSSYRHLCAALGARAPYFRYDWRREGGWNLLFVAGIGVGGLLAGFTLTGAPPNLAAATRAHLSSLGIAVDGALAPSTLFSLAALATPGGFIAMLVGGFLVGFGARWANGCTSGHAISGLAEGRLGSLIAVIGFFAGGLLTTHLLWPLLAGWL